MQNKKIWLLAASLLLVVGCANNKPKDNKLKLSVDDNETGLQWAAVRGATGYRATVTGEEPEALNDPFYEFETDEGEYHVLIEALKGEKVLKSAEFDYETSTAYISDIDYEDGVIRHAADYVGKEILYRFNDGEWLPFTQDIEASQPGLYVVRGSRGWVEESHKYYPTNAEKGIYLAVNASESYDLELGDEESEEALRALYDIKEYKKVTDTAYDWAEPEVGSVALANYSYYDDPRAFAETGVKFTYKANGNYHKFEQALHAVKAYKGLTFKVKSTIKTEMVLSFQILHDVQVGAINLNGVYLKYKVSSLPTTWQLINVNFDDENWKVNYNGTDYPLATVAGMINMAGFKVSALSDLFPLCDVFQVKLCGNVGGSAVSETIIDNMALLPVKPANEKVDMVETFSQLKPTYFVKTGVGMGQLVVGETSTLQLNVNGTIYPIPVTTTILDNYKVNVKSTATGMDFDATFTTLDQAKTLVFESVTGSLATYIDGAQVQEVRVLDDFESYSATGTGYHQGNTNLANMAGLQKAYYGDYKSTPASNVRSLLDDNSEGSTQRWTLMGGDYQQIQLVTSGAFLGSKAMKIKASSSMWMRYTQSSLVSELQGTVGAAEAWEQATALALIIKGTEKKQTVRLRLHWDSPVVVKQFGARCDYKDLSVAVEGSGWGLYLVPLSVGRTYYGWSAALDSGSGNNGKFIQIDQVMLIH